MSQDPSSVFDAARILASRRRAGEQGARLPLACRPANLAQAWQIQVAASQLMGDSIGGWKCALPAPDRLTVAPIYQRTIHASSEAVCPVWAREAQVRVEPELAFVLGRDLPARPQPYTHEEIDAAVARTHLALELIDSRYVPEEAAQASFAEKLADGLVNQGLYLGPVVDADQASLASCLDITVSESGHLVAQHEGQHPNLQPRGPLYWLVNHLRSEGMGLLAGQAVITGSYAGTWSLPLGVAIDVRYGHLGTLCVCFSALTKDD